MTEPINYAGLPEVANEIMRRYIEYGCYPGSGMLAVLENNLRAVLLVDDRTLAHLPQIYRWLANNAPPEAWGSAEKVARWMKARATAIPQTGRDEHRMEQARLEVETTRYIGEEIARCGDGFRG
jgi:plasmid stabilization system protein ParE